MRSAPPTFPRATFSAAASLAGVVVLFDIVRRTINVNSGLIAAALMAISPLQINLSQETRPYPLLLLFGLLACHALFRIERQGATPGRLFQLGLFVTATALTHYFSFGALLAIVCYAFLRLRGSDRRKTIAVLCASAMFVLIVWGPFLWRQRPQYFGPQPWSFEASSTALTPWIRSAAIPSATLVRPGRKSIELDRSRNHRLSAPALSAAAISANSAVVAVDRGKCWIDPHLRWHPPRAIARNDPVRRPGVRRALLDVLRPDSDPEIVAHGPSPAWSSQGLPPRPLSGFRKAPRISTATGAAWRSPSIARRGRMMP